MIKIYIPNSNAEPLFQDSKFYWGLLDFAGEKNLKYVCSWGDGDYILSIEDDDLILLMNELEFVKDNINEYLQQFIDFNKTNILKNGGEIEIEFNKTYVCNFFDQLIKLAGIAHNESTKLIFDPYEH